MLIFSGSAVIITPPNNMTKVDGEKAIFPCEWRANPSNSTVIWYRDGIPTRQISSLESRVSLLQIYHFDLMFIPRREGFDKGCECFLSDRDAIRRKSYYQSRAHGRFRLL